MTYRDNKTALGVYPAEPAGTWAAHDKAGCTWRVTEDEAGEIAERLAKKGTVR